MLSQAHRAMPMYMVGEKSKAVDVGNPTATFSLLSLGTRRVMLGRSSKCNRQSKILAAIDCNRNRDKTKAKCDFDHTLFRCCSVQSLSALSSHLTRAYWCNEAGGQWSAWTTLGDWGRGRRPEGHNGVISITGSAISPASVHALTLDSTQTVTWSRQWRTGFDRHSAGESTTFDAERDLHLTDCELVTEKEYAKLRE